MGDEITKIVLWNKPGDDIFGRLSRSDKLMDMIEAVNHYL